MVIKDLENKINELEKRLDKLENKKEWEFTEKEKLFLSLVNSKYNYIARDGFTNSLYLYQTKPIKENRTWYNKGSVDFLHISRDDFSLEFNTIQWTDDEPCEFRKYIGDVE